MRISDGSSDVCSSDLIVTAGLSPEQARRAGHEIRTAQFPFQANGRAMTTESEAGFVRVVARADNHLVLGVQAVGAGVSELAAPFALALEMGRSEEHTSELQSLMRISYAVFFLKKKKTQ